MDRYEELVEKVGAFDRPWLNDDSSILTAMKNRGIEGDEALSMLEMVKELKRVSILHERKNKLLNALRSEMTEAKHLGEIPVDLEITFKEKYESLYKQLIEMDCHIDGEERIVSADEAWDELQNFWRKKEEKRAKNEIASRKRLEAKETDQRLKAELIKEMAVVEGLRCRFIRVATPYSRGRQKRFVVEMPNEQVMCFDEPKGRFDRSFYDNAISLCKIFREDCMTSEKKLADKTKNFLARGDKRRKVADALIAKLGDGWRGLFDESKRKYLSAKYKDEV